MRMQRSVRPAFTITEMLVATALIMFIMVIIAQAFGSASKTFNTLRTAGELQERLRTVSTILRKDLTAEHFDGPYIPARSGPRLGDQRLDLPGWVPPRAGYFEIHQDSAVLPALYEPGGTPAPAVWDGERLASTRATDHWFRFTVKLPPSAAAELFSAAAPPEAAGLPGVNAFPNPAIFYSRWAEVVYFLHLDNVTDQTTQSAGGSLQRYSLRRRIRVLAPRMATLPRMYTTAEKDQVVQTYTEIPLIPFQLPPPNETMWGIVILGPEEVTRGGRIPRAPISRLTPNGVVFGDDILMTDVISFEVKAAWLRNFAFNNNDVPNPPTTGTYGSSPDVAPMFDLLNPLSTRNDDYPFDNIPRTALKGHPPGGPVGPRIFDTYYIAGDGIDWSNPSVQTSPYGAGILFPSASQPPLRINVRALQIKIRVWDAKSEQSRQVTIVQEV